MWNDTSIILFRVNQEDFITVNHEMGHIQYFLQYKKLPYLYRSGDYRYCHASIILSMYKGGIIGDRTSQKKFLSSIAENINVIGAIPVDKRWTCFYVIFSFSSLLMSLKIWKQGPLDLHNQVRNHVISILYMAIKL